MDLKGYHQTEPNEKHHKSIISWTTCKCLCEKKLTISIKREEHEIYDISLQNDLSFATNDRLKGYKN